MAAPLSKLATIQWNYHLRVYYQNKDNEIIELCHDGSGWTTGATMPLLSGKQPSEGTAIASIGWNDNSIRNYVQGEDNYIWEYVHESGWSSHQLLQYAKPYTPLAAVTWSDNKVSFFSEEF